MNPVWSASFLPVLAEDINFSILSAANACCGGRRIHNLPENPVNCGWFASQMPFTGIK